MELSTERETDSQVHLRALADDLKAAGRTLAPEWLGEAYDEIQSLREQVAELKREVNRLTIESP